MGTPIIFIYTGEAFAILYRESEILRRAEFLGITLVTKHPEEDLSDVLHHRMNVGTIGHIDHGGSALALAIARSFRLGNPFLELKPELLSITEGDAAQEFLNIRRQHEQDFRRKSKQLLPPTRNFCCRRR